MGEQQVQGRVSRVRRLVSLGGWLLAAAAAAVVGLDPENLARS